MIRTWQFAGKVRIDRSQAQSGVKLSHSYSEVCWMWNCSELTCEPLDAAWHNFTLACVDKQQMTRSWNPSVPWSWLDGSYSTNWNISNLVYKFMACRYGSNLFPFEMLKRSRFPWKVICRLRAIKNCIRILGAQRISNSFHRTSLLWLQWLVTGTSKYRNSHSAKFLPLDAETAHRQTPVPILTTPLLSVQKWID